MHPNEGKLIDIMTQIWIDAGQHEKALQYWIDEHAKDPKDIEVITRVAAIHRMAGEWRKSIDWHEKESKPRRRRRAKRELSKTLAT